MYINPFFAGVLATICAEVLCAFIYSLQHSNRPNKIASVKLTPEEMKEIVDKLEGISSGENNDN